MSQMTASLVILTPKETIEYLKKVPDAPSEYQFIHMTRFTNAKSIEANPSELASGIQRVYAHNSMEQFSWLIWLCKDYIQWDLHNTGGKHGDDDQG